MNVCLKSSDTLKEGDIEFASIEDYNDVADLPKIQDFRMVREVCDATSSVSPDHNYIVFKADPDTKFAIEHPSNSILCFFCGLPNYGPLGGYDIYIFHIHRGSVVNPLWGEKINNNELEFMIDGGDIIIKDPPGYPIL